MTSFAVKSSSEHPFESQQNLSDPQETATGVYVAVHGHFYQPPRENPYLDAIERQASAHPCHDWNERIYHECYRPNAFARVLNSQGEVVEIVNNFEYLSFNIGPTLMSWLERYDLEVYQRILEADRKSCERLGYGNAIAQAYNHIILPLANKRDKYTQVRWGKEDFRARFQRDPQGMWLAETAVDYPTLEVLIDEGIEFIVLAPSQAERCRMISGQEQGETEWHEVGGGQIDPTRPYRCFIEDGRYIDIFFYDGPISGDMGFSEALNSSQNLAGRLGQAVRGDHRSSQLISVATDGETFGHHKGGTEKCLAYAFTQEFPNRGWQVTNFAHYLTMAPPTWEVKLKPVTAWSCSHGVERWQNDCGCGGGGVWHQQWRKPLREALNWLRDRLVKIYNDAGREIFLDPWQARDEYIQVILDRSSDKVSHFLARHQLHQLSPAQQTDALRLLEMQRHSLLMFTSCGWFFEEISRPEGVQILRYASRAIELAGDVAGVQLEKEFLSLLAQAPSNVDKFGNGAEVYRQLVVSAQVGFDQVAAHYAISSLFNDYPKQYRIYCYDAQQLDYQRQQIGSLTLALGQIRLTSEITQEGVHLVFAVLHLGGWDFHCCIKSFGGRREYSKLKEELWSTLEQGSAAKTILALNRAFGEKCFGLDELFAEERQRIMQQLTEDTKNRLDQLYTQVYRSNYGILMAFRRDDLPVPQELQVAADIALAHRCLLEVRALEQFADEPQQWQTHLAKLEVIATEAKRLHSKLQVPEAKRTLEQLILRLLWQLLYDRQPTSLKEDVQTLERSIDVGKLLNLNLDISRAQELYFHCLHQQIIPSCLEKDGEETCRWQNRQLPWILDLGQRLGVDTSNLSR